MPDLWFRLLLGHLAGDYLLQSKSMAIGKSQPGGQGLWQAILHCLIYTAVVCLFLWTASPLVIVLVFLSHFPIDRWSLASHWFRLIRGREIKQVYTDKEKGWEVALSFACLVYAVADNTMHLILLWLIVKFFI